MTLTMNAKLTRALPMSILVLMMALVTSSCQKDDAAEKPAPAGGGCATPNSCGTLTDIDGNTYSTVQIGAQCWMAENLRTSRYRNGDAIPTGLDSLGWQTATTGAYCYYADSGAMNADYGKLYNWYAVADPRGLCPNGWHVPTDDEWKVLELSLGMSASEVDLQIGGPRGEDANVGGKLKTTTSDWLSPNTGANNCIGFGSRPAGKLEADFYGLGYFAQYWTSTAFSGSQAFNRTTYYANASVGYTSANGKQQGQSCRCVAD